MDKAWEKGRGIHRWRRDGGMIDVQFCAGGKIYRYTDVGGVTADRFEGSMHQAGFVSKHLTGKTSFVILTDAHIEAEAASYNLAKYGTTTPTLLQIRQHCRSMLGLDEKTA